MLITLVVGMAGTAFASTEGTKKRGKKHRPAQGAGEPSRPLPPAPAPKAPAAAKPKASAGSRPSAPAPAKGPDRKARGDGKAGSGISAAMEDWVRNLPPGGNEAMLRLLGLAPPPAAPAGATPAPDPVAKAAADLRAMVLQGLQRKLDANPGYKNFRGLDLEGSGLDLSGRVLNYGDFRGSRLASVRFRDARLKHARFFEADIRGAVDLDLSEAELHPFFQADPGDPVGQVKTLLLPDLGTGGADLPGQLAMTRNRVLVWVPEGGQLIRAMSSTGCPYEARIEAGTRLQAVQIDPEDRILLYQNQLIRVLPASQFLGSTAPHWPKGTNHIGLSQVPRELVFSGNSALFSLQGRISVFVPEDGSGAPFNPRNLDLPGEGWHLAGAALPWLAFLDPSADELRFHHLSQEKTYVYRLERAGSRPRSMAVDQDGRFWITLEGAGAIARMTLTGNDPEALAALKPELFPLATEGFGPRTPHGIAQGEDGNLWYTDPGAHCIGRISPEGGKEDFRLDPGQRPIRIFPSGDKRMLFTLEGRAVVASIRTVQEGKAERKADRSVEDPGDSEPDAKGSAASGEGPALELEARPPSPEASAEDLKDFEDAERDPALAALAELAPAETKSPSVPGIHAGDTGRAEAAPEPAPGPAGQPRTEGKSGTTRAAPVQAPAETPWKRLRRRDVVLDPEMARQILGKHRRGAYIGKSQFHAGVSSVEDLARLLADGLGTQPIGNESDRPGRRLTYLDLKGAGHLKVPGVDDPEQGWRNTDWVLLVTIRKPGPKGLHRHYVINAYPVKPRR